MKRVLKPLTSFLLPSLTGREQRSSMRGSMGAWYALRQTHAQQAIPSSDRHDRGLSGGYPGV